MALNYKIIDTSGKVSLVETKTDYIVREYDSREQARPLLRHLNLGGGFAGFTPTFFTHNMQKYINKVN